MSRSRTFTAGVAAATLLLAAVPASAAVDTFAAEAEAAGLSLSIAGFDVLDLGLVQVSAVPGAAAAYGVPLAIGGEPIGDLAAESTGAPDSDSGCVAEVPAPLDTVLGAGLACAEVTADGSVPEASAVAGVAELGVLDLSAAQLGALGDVLGQVGLDELLDAVAGPLGEQVLGPVVGELQDQCVGELSALAAVLDPLGVLGLQDMVDELADAAPAELAALLGQIAAVPGLVLPAVCDVLLDVTDLLGGDLVAAITRGDLLTALAGTDGLLSVSLLESGAEVARDDDLVGAAAGPTGAGAIELTLSLPLLEEVLEQLLADALAPLLAALEPLLDPLGGAVEPIPAIGPLVSDALSGGSLAELLSGGPLLAVGVAPGAAIAVADLTDGSTDGEAEPALVQLDGTLFALPGLSELDAALNEVAGTLDSQLLAQLRDTPLVDLVDVRLLEGEVVDEEVGGLPGTRATSGTASVTLLAVLGDPLLDLDVAAATAAVGAGDAAPGPVTVVPSGPTPGPVTPTLPVTGGGAALLGLAALGVAAALGRRQA